MSVHTNHTSWIGKVHRTHAEQTNSNNQIQPFVDNIGTYTVPPTQTPCTLYPVSCFAMSTLLQDAWCLLFFTSCVSDILYNALHKFMHKANHLQHCQFLVQYSLYNHPLFLRLFCWVSPTITLSDTGSIAATHNRYVWWNPLYICIIWDLIIAS